MTTTITIDRDPYELHRFHADLRRALLMHRTGRLNFFYTMQFPQAQAPFDEDEELLRQLDFRQWLAEDPPESIHRLGVYHNLVANLERLLVLSRRALEAPIDTTLFADILYSMHEFDRLVDRLLSGVITTLTDVDGLTGLLNRTAMERDLEKELAHFQRSGRPFTVAMIDADLFKRVNDEFGHGFGDVVLETLADRFVESLRPRDRVYRYGGEEFLVLLPETPLESALPVLERLRRRASERTISDGSQAVRQSVSIGAAEIGREESVEVVVARSDQALYRAKQAGRDRVELDHGS